MSSVDSPIVILGCRRSGTTLLAAILKSHPQLLVHPHEVQFFLELYKKFGLEIRDRSAAIDLVCRHPYRAESVTPEALEKLSAGKGTLSLQDFSQLYLRAWAGESPAQLVIKHPKLILHPEQVALLFPNARLIHMVRDPRANVASQRARWPEAALRECIEWWRRSLHNGRTRARNEPETCLEIRYEDLVLSPRETLTEVCSFAGLDFNEAMLEFSLETKSYQAGERPERRLYTRIDPSRLSRWRQALPAVDVRLIEEACVEEMGWWGYVRDQPEVNRFALLWRDLTDRSYSRFRQAGRAVRDALR